MSAGELHVGVLWTTGPVGSGILEVPAERRFPLRELRAAAVAPEIE